MVAQPAVACSATATIKIRMLQGSVVVLSATAIRTKVASDHPTQEEAYLAVVPVLEVVAPLTNHQDLEVETPAVVASLAVQATQTPAGVLATQRIIPHLEVEAEALHSAMLLRMPQTMEPVELHSQLSPRGMVSLGRSLTKV